ncbi:MAG: hypothetical protein JWL77_1289 [Chthonomonadaceae bacterium]|nr:hypothetical protein [Chthonomonadaceae bacterium]
MERAYRRTAYRVDDGGDSFEFRIGIRHPKLDALLDRHKARSWAFVTAYNPYSQPLDDRANRRRQAAFERSLFLPFLHGKGQGLVGNWTPEASVLLMGITPQRARRLGSQWEQAAVVIGVRGGRPRLQWPQPAIFM